MESNFYDVNSLRGNVFNLRQGSRGEGKEQALSQLVNTHPFFDKVNARELGLQSFVVRFKVVVTDKVTNQVNEVLTTQLNTLESAESYVKEINALPKQYDTKIEQIYY